MTDEQVAIHARQSAELAVEQGFWEAFVADTELGVDIETQMSAFVAGAEPWEEDLTGIDNVQLWIFEWRRALHILRGED